MRCASANITSPPSNTLYFDENQIYAISTLDVSWSSLKVTSCRFKMFKFSDAQDFKMFKILRCSRFLDAQDVQMLKCDDLNSHLCCKSGNSTLFVNNTEEERSVDVDCRLCVRISYRFIQILVDINYVKISR